MTQMMFRAVPDAPGEPVFSRWMRTMDWGTVYAVLGLFAIGLLLSEASSPALAIKRGLSEFHYVKRQLFFGVAGLGTMLVVSLLDPRAARRWSVRGFVIIFLLVLLLPFFGTNHGKGAMRWYSVFGFSFQPSEFLKPFFVVTAAWIMSSGFARNGPPGVLMSLGLMLLVSGTLAMQPDLGQAALVAVSWAVMYFVAGAPLLVVTLLGAGAVVAGFVAYANFDHFRIRVDNFIAGDVNPTSQIGKALQAIQEGGLFGVGIGQGHVKETLPDAYTDFIIAVAAEEFGMVLCLAIIALFMVVVVRALMQLWFERDTFTRLAGCGLAALFSCQALINLAVSAQLIPPKGMTLPFVSYGGSSLIGSGIGIGLLLAMTRRRPQQPYDDLFGAVE